MEIESVQNTNNSQDDETDEIIEKPFLDRVDDLIDNLLRVEGYSNNSGLMDFRKIVSTIKNKKGMVREKLENGMKVIFSNFYNQYRDFILEEKSDFLAGTEDKPIVIIFGKSGKAHIPLSEEYNVMLETNPEMIDSIEGCLYFIFQHVCPDEDLDSIMEICKEFSPEEYSNPDGLLAFVGKVIGRVSDKFDGDNSPDINDKDGNIDPMAIGTVVSDLVGDDVIQESIKNMISSVNQEDFDVTKVFNGLMK